MLLAPVKERAAGVLELFCPQLEADSGVNTGSWDPHQPCLLPAFTCLSLALCCCALTSRDP